MAKLSTANLICCHDIQVGSTHSHGSVVHISLHANNCVHILRLPHVFLYNCTIMYVVDYCATIPLLGRYYTKPDNSIQRTQNLGIALEFITETEKIPLVNIGEL